MHTHVAPRGQQPLHRVQKEDLGPVLKGPSECCPPGEPRQGPGNLPSSAAKALHSSSLQKCPLITCCRYVREPLTCTSQYPEWRFYGEAGPCQDKL